MIEVERIDHLVLTVRDLDQTCRFYADVLGLTVVPAGDRTSLVFGTQKLNLHVVGHEFEPKALKPTPGSADVCFITTTPVCDVLAHLHEMRVKIVAGPVKRVGALGSMLSVYVRDPDGNLVELSNYSES